MARVYSPESTGRERTRLCKSIVLALRELMKQSEPNELTRDLAAYVVLALEEIAEGIDTSVAAWEKRDYWVKADKFRLEWEWAGKIAQNLRAALLADDWGMVAMNAVKIGQQLKKVTVAERHRLGTPWLGAWKKFKG